MKDNDFSFLQRLLSKYPPKTPVIEAVTTEQLRMLPEEGTVVFRTRSGIQLEVRDGSLYTTNEPAVRAALEEDLHSENAIDVTMAGAIIDMMCEYGVVAEA